MSEVSRLLFEMGAGTLTLLLSVLAQRRAGRSASCERRDSISCDSIGDQIDAIDALIEMRTEPALKARRADDEWRAMIRRRLLDIEDLAALTEPPRRGFEEPLSTTPLDAAVAAVLTDPESSPQERARIFMSTGTTFNGFGGSFGARFVGNRGAVEFFIASGTSQTDIISAFQRSASHTGVAALQDTVDPALIRLVSLRRGPRQFVGGTQTYGVKAKMFLDQNRMNHADAQIDFGA